MDEAKQQELREMWHDLNNHLNIITTSAGFFTYMNEDGKYESLEGSALKEEFKKMLAQMKTFDERARKVGELSKALKKETYKLLNIDTSKPLAKKDDGI